MHVSLYGVILALILNGCSDSAQQDGSEAGQGRDAAIDLSFVDGSSADSAPQDAVADDGPAADLPSDTGPVFQLTLVDPGATTAYATFQSHNEKVVSTSKGIFISYLHSYDDSGGDAATKANWRLDHSTDRGQTFQTIYQATHATKAPALACDDQDNLFLVHPDWGGQDAAFYRFAAADNYASPTITTIPGGSAGKYTLLFDPKWQLFYYMTWTHLFTLDPQGSVVASKQLLVQGANANPQYPHLTRNSDGALFASWTTTALADNHYYDIHFMTSWDGGNSWGLPWPGQMVTLPVICDDTGPAVSIVLPTEVSATDNRWNWLANTLFKDGKLHFLYGGMQDGSWQTVYARYNWSPSDPKVDHRISPAVQGQTTVLSGLDGFFASDDQPGSPIYLVAHAENGGIGALRSTDQGTTWHDHAWSQGYQAPQGRAVYAVGGGRRLSMDGDIIGTFTEQDTVGDQHRVYFFRIETR